MQQAGWLEHSGRHNDERMSRKIGNAQSCGTFFRHSAVLLRELPMTEQMHGSMGSICFI